MTSILYITTNNIWGGSEELWTRSAKSFIDKGYSIAFASKYEHAELSKINAPHINFTEPNGLKSVIQRGIRRFTAINFPQQNLLRDFINQTKPRLILISQGDTFQAIDVMQCCSKMNVPYIVITQLVGEIFISGFAYNKLAVVQQAYTKAKKTFFVSHHNLQLHNAMLGLDLPNAEVVFNPCKIADSEIPEYPEPDGIYNIAFVGRIDCWHKGYDLLLQIIREEKWQRRPVRFNMYGTGVYLEYMKDMVAAWKLSNVVFKGHSNHISQVWGENQILCMPSRMEGQALALIEAMRCRRAAIVTDVGGAAELIEEGYSGFIAVLPAIEPIDAALERAWQHRNKWKEMGLNAATALKAKYPADAVVYFNQKVLEQLT